MNLKKQLACIYTNNFFSGLRITDAVWVALLAARGFSLWEIGIAESVFHMVSLTFEVPSGMAADLLGRRKTLVAGGVCMVLSNLLMAFAPDLFFICLAMALSALANAMFSGTASALTYDSLKQCGRNRRLPPGLRQLLPALHAGHGCGVPRQHAGTVSPLFRFLPAERRL